MAAPPLSPAQRSQRARVAALVRWSGEDPAAHAKHMRECFDQRFHRQVDPDGVLPEAERQRRAIAARRAYFAGLALKSSQVRQRAGRVVA